MRGGLLRHLLSRVPEFLPCCATVVIPDFDRHSKTITVLVRCGGALQEDSYCQERVPQTAGGVPHG